MNDYRVGVIGSTGRGNYGHGIDSVWKDVPRCAVVAVADDNEAGRAKAVELTGAKTAYADYREMLDKEKLDVVGIGPRWVDRHAEMIFAAVERGVHVYLEKPFCRTPAEADAIVTACEMRHVRLAIAHQTRYSPVLAQVKRLLQAESIGTVLELRARGKEDQRGGAEDLWVLGSHVLNVCAALAGEPTSCMATVRVQGEPARREQVIPNGNEGLGPLLGDWVEATYRFPNGIAGYFASRRGMGGGGRATRFGVQIFGSQGVIEILPGFGEPAWLLADAGWSPGRTGGKWVPVTALGIDQPDPQAMKGLHAGNVAAVNDLLDAIEKQREPLCSARDGRTTVEMILGVFASHLEGRPVSLPLSSRNHPLVSA